MNPLPDLLIAARGPRTVTHLAAAAGCSRRTINLYEQGRALPSLRLLLRLVAALGLDAPARRAILDAHMTACARVQS
jgi:transcriptional regulator with XRE-family HTH domain